MTNNENPNDLWSEQHAAQPTPASGPSGATDAPKEREKNFDSEGGAQSQAQASKAQRDAFQGERDPERATSGSEIDDEDVEVEGEDRDSDDDTEPDGLSQPNMKERS